jgi:hypothetical protein
MKSLATTATTRKEKDWSDHPAQFLSSHQVSEERIREFREVR